MQTKNFRTKTEFIPRNNGKVNGVWEIALDIGYSAVKIFSPNMIASFPSYARRDNNITFASTPPEDAILYKDGETGEQWIVGAVAQNTIQRDATDSIAALYGRERYFNPLFKVIARTGLAIAMQPNEFGDRGDDKIVVQTGLPERYKADEDILIESLSGRHKFELKIGSGPWRSYDFAIRNSEIYVMSQPKGTLLSICISKNGAFIPDAEKYLRSSILVFDPGFGTFDLFSIVKGVVGHGETFNDLGMKRVLQETCDDIKKEYGVDIEVPAMQAYLETGQIKFFDRKSNTSGVYHFERILENANRRVCEEAINRTLSVFNIVDYDYLVVTGGTGAAWLDIIKEKFKNMSTIKIINGNQNDNLPFIYSNVRGYYVNRYNKLLS